MQTINTAACIALLASIASYANAEIEWHFETDLTWARAFQINVASSQLTLLKEAFRKNTEVKALVAAGRERLATSVEDDSFTWLAYKEEIATFLSALSEEDQALANESALQNYAQLEPSRWNGEFDEIQWDAMNHLIQASYDNFVANGGEYDLVDPLLAEWQGFVERAGAATAFAAGSEFFRKEFSETYIGFYIKFATEGTSYARNLYESNRNPPNSGEEDPTSASASAGSASSTEAPITTTEPPTTNATEPAATTATPVPAATASASLATLSMAVATVAISVAAMFA